MNIKSESLSIALLWSCWLRQNINFAKSFIAKVKLGYSSKTKAYDLSYQLKRYSNKHLILLGSSESVLEYEEYVRANGTPEDHVIIGCNFTNYLDLKLDIFISAHLITCLLAARSEAKPSIIINASKNGGNVGAGIFGVKRRNFDNNVEKITEAALQKEGGVLYTNQNVLFLMINLAFNMKPKSITLCGFEDTLNQGSRARFYQKSPALMNKIFLDIISLGELDLLGHGHQQPSAELLNLVYNYLWVPLGSFVDSGLINETKSRERHVDIVSKKRNKFIQLFLESKTDQIPLYRYGVTSLVSSLETSPYLASRK